MGNKRKTNKKELALTAGLLLLLFAISACSLNNAITGFAVLDNTTNETEQTTATNETTTQETTETPITDATTETTINETTTEITNETQKGKPDDKGPAEEKEANQPPVWKADADSIIIDGITIIDLNDYFSDKNNDTIGYALGAAEKITIEADNNMVTFKPEGNSFNSTVSITASDGDKSTAKEVILIVPERKITIELEYKSGSVYDSNDDGVEDTYGIIDLTTENTGFNWEVNEENLCTRWETYSVEDEESTIVCYGSSKCCSFVDLAAAKPVWNEPFYSSYGQYGATYNNIISAQVLHVDYGISANEPYAEIYNSEWKDLSASYYSAFSQFENVCADTCLLTGFNESSYTLIFEIEGAVLELDKLIYTTVETISQVLVNLNVQDNEGEESGTYNLYKGNVLVNVVDNFVEPDYYDIEVIPDAKVIEKLFINNANITKPLTANIGIDNVSRQQEIENVEIKKQYAIDASGVEFETGTLTATAEANSLYKCKQWDYDTEVCYGTWEKIKDLTVGEEYNLILTADDPGFVEGNLNVTAIPINITELALFKDISNITISKNNNYTLDLNEYFSNIDNSTIYTYNQMNNISMLFDANTATIVPDKGFIGKEFTFITAANDDDSAISNIFSITVSNMTINITPEIILEKKDFRLDEDVEIDFEYLGKKELIKEGRWKEEYEVYEEETDKTEQELKTLREKIEDEEKLLSEAEKAIKKQKKKFIKETETIEAFVVDNEGNLEDINIEIEELREGKFDIKLQKQRAFRAGKYTIKLELVKDGITYTQEQDFTWGVLAINTNKSIYLPNEDSFIGIGVLDDQGKIVCSADVTLEIINPLNQKTTLTTSNNEIKISPECQVLGITELPDYYTAYSVGGIGTYLMNLTAITSNGVRSIQDNFSVMREVDFDVARKGPTRVYPAVAYTMKIPIKANKNYNGIINEYVPSSFAITPQDGLTVTTINDTNILSWNANLNAGDKIELNYEFDAPDISPEFYLLGPLDIGSFKEARQWQIANDLYGNVKFFDEFADFTQWTESGSPQNDWVAIRDAAIAGIVGGGTACPLAAAGGSNITIATSVDLSDCTAGTGRANWTQNTGTQSDNIDCLKYQTSTDGGATWGTLATAVCDDPAQTTFKKAQGYEIPDVDLVSTFKFRFQCQGFTSGTEFINVSMFNITCDVAPPDSTKPRINASLDDFRPVRGQVVNMTANVSDNQALSTCNFFMNGTADGSFIILNKTVAGTNDQCSQNFTIDLTVGNVINFTVKVNDAQANFNLSVNRSDGGAEVIGQIIRVRQKADVSGGSWDNLTAQACNLEDLAATQGTFDLACDTTYPGTCATGVNGVSCNDGTELETFTSSTTSNWGGLNISAYNDLITDCEDIGVVRLCYEWWASDTTIQSCDISVDADGGTSYTAATTTCPGAVADPGVICTDVTALETWACGSFFGEIGTRAMAKAAGQKSGGGGTRTFTVDALWFNVTYRSTVLPPDTTAPVINGTINNTAPKFGEVINATYNITDSGGALSTGNISINISGNPVQNFSFKLSGTKRQISQNITINLTKGNVINITGFARDTAGLISQNSTLITVANSPPSTPAITFPSNNQYFNSKPIWLNVTFPADADSDAITIQYYINSKLNDSTSVNTTFNGSDGTYRLNVTIFDGEEYTANTSYINFTLDTVFPVVNTTLNKSFDNIILGDVINISANITDSVGLSFCQIIINQSGPTALNIQNISLNGATSAQCYNISSISLSAGSVINFTIRVNDTSNNFRTNDTIITVAATPDIIAPVIQSTAINNTAPKVNEVVQVSANASDETAIYNVMVAHNLTGTFVNQTPSKADSGATSMNHSINLTNTLVRGNAVGFVFTANDTTANTVQSATITYTVADTTPTFTLANNNTNAKINEVTQLSAMVNDSDILSMVIASWNGTNGVWINISNSTTLAAGLNYSVNRSVGLVRGNTIGWLFYANDSVVNTFTASSLNTFVVADAAPTFDTSINDSSLIKDEVARLSAMVNDSDTLSMVIASWNGTNGVWINISNTTSLALGVNYSVNRTVGLGRGNTIGWMFYANDSVVSTFTASSLNTVVVDDTAPTFTMAINNTSPNLNEFVRFSALVNDSDVLSMVIASWNGTNGVWINISNSTTLAAGLNYSVNRSVGLTFGNTVGWLFYANDSVANTFTASSLNTFAVADTIAPTVNTSLNKSLSSIFQNDVINFSANLTDPSGLSFCQIIINQSGPTNIHYENISLNGATSAQCYNVSAITLTAGSVINFTIRANDTAGNFRTNDTIITVASAATAPVVRLNNASFSVDPVAGDSVKVSISFNVTDEQGIGDINATKAIVNFTLGPPSVAQFRFNISEQGGEFGTCSNHTLTAPEPDVMVINCTVLMRYYDNASSNWVVNVSVQDLGGLVGRDDTVTFTYNSLQSFSITSKNVLGEKANLNFTANIRINDQAAKSPILINNTGNTDFLKINITGADLLQIGGNDFIGIGNFTINITNSSSGLGLILSKAAQAIPGNDDTANATLLHGPGVSGDSAPYPGVADFKTKGNMTLFFWVDIPTALPVGTYNNTWNLTVIDLP
ncbi:hypothetical protein HYU09_02435 [Candidatus Woesearchaeota archaeon]|nr:hypothetical protein [Candidatus Woesearchaeota archaeon]